MSQFYAETNFSRDFILIRNKEEIHHIVKVRRYKTGDKIKIFDGKGNRFLTEIEEIEKGFIKLRKIKPLENTEPEICISLYFPIFSFSKVKEILKIGTELGVREFIPVITDFLSIKKRKLKIEKIRKIIIEECKQSERSFIPEILDLLNFRDAILRAKRNSEVFLFSLNAPRIKLEEVADRISVFIGPEGGYSLREIDFARKNGVKVVSICKTVLRVEVAVAASLSLFLQNC